MKFRHILRRRNLPAALIFVSAVLLLALVWSRARNISEGQWQEAFASALAAGAIVLVAGVLLLMFVRQQRATSRLRRSEHYFRNLTDLTSDWYWEQDENLRFSYFSPQFERYSFLNPVLSLGKARWEIAGTVEPLDWSAHRATLAARKPFRNFILGRRDRNGDLRYSSNSGEPIFDRQGVFRGYRGVSRDVTAEKQAEEALRQSEARFRSLTGLSSDWYWEQDEHFRFTNMSSQMELSGGPVPASEHIGKTRWDIPSPNMTEADWARHRAILEAHLPFRDFEVCRHSEEDKVYFASISGEPMFDGDGRFSGYRGVGRDITATKREQDLLRMEHAFSRRLTEAADADSLIRDVIRGICETGNWECGQYWRVDEQAGFIRGAVNWFRDGTPLLPFVDQSGEVMFSRGEGLVGWTWQYGEAWISDATEDRRLHRKELAVKVGLRAAWLLPVVSEGVTIGVLSFYSRTVRAPDERMQRSVQTLGSQIGQFVQRRRAERELREREERFRGLTELSSDWYWEQDKLFRFVAISGGVRDRSGLSDLAHMGKTRWELPVAEVSEAQWQAHKALLAAHQPFRNFIYRRPDLDGRQIFVSTSGDPIHDAAENFVGYRGIGRDVTAEIRGDRIEKMERDVLEMVVRGDALKSIFDTLLRGVEGLGVDMRASILLLDADGGHLRIGAAPSLPEAYNNCIDGVEIGPRVGSCGTAVYRRERVIVGDIANDPLWADFRELALSHDLRACWSEPLRGGADQILGTFAMYYSAPREPSEDDLDLVGFAARIAAVAVEHARAREQAAQMTSTLELRVTERTADLAMANEELAFFSRSASHDMRTALRSIISYAQMLLADAGEVFPADQRKKLERISLAGLRLGGILDAIQELSRTARSQIRVAQVDLASLAREVMERLRQQQPDRRAELEIPEHLLVHGDAGMMHMVIENLLGNAWKYSGRRELTRISLSVSPPAAQSSAPVPAPVYCVRDNGAGFDMAYVDKLFQPFERLHGDGEFPGLGTGLATVRKIIERHGGRIWAESAPGSGTALFFTLWEFRVPAEPRALPRSRQAA